MKILSPAFYRFPHFLYLLPFFFVFHGYVQGAEGVTLIDFTRLFAKYLLSGAVLFSIGYLAFRSVGKAALFSFCLLFFHLFFGAFHDFLKGISPEFFLARYTVLLPVLLIFLVLFFIYLRKSYHLFRKLFAYLNLLFLTLVVVDVIFLLNRPEGKQPLVRLQPCANCDKTDVYLFIADEYADSTSLATIFQFNNGAFQHELRKRGFHFLKSVSNYNYTPFSIASLLSMEYLNGLEGRNSSYADRLTCATYINNNAVENFFVSNGYQLRNNSMYKFGDVQTEAPQMFFRVGTDFIDSHTFLSRLDRDLGYHLVTTLKLDFMIRKYRMYQDGVNRLLLNRLSSDTKVSQDQSRFIFTHILMPHDPFYRKKDGSWNAEAWNPANKSDKNAYIEYLQYSNKIFLKTIDEIFRHAKKPPIVLFMGDHGYRGFTNPTQQEKMVQFMNINAVYLPSGDYRRFYEGISGVNQFRVLLNTVFGQQLPLLKDSTSFLQE